MSKYGTTVRDSDKFMMRLPASLHAAMMMIAKANCRSLNSEITYAFAQWFDPASSGRLTHQLLMGCVDTTTAALAIAKVDRKFFEGRPVKFCCRFAPGQRGLIAGSANPENEVSMNSYSISVLSWWVTNHRETQTLFDVVRRSGYLKTSMSPGLKHWAEDIRETRLYGN
ncbi:Arc family DNA-binding protein [Pseudomonas corrugata]|uniref:Arc family DNA-binding protein n=1 Tax=Pseudomonas corrugata TaxID=47879 RepID=UPI0018E66318|nr:Arc family DNA-binding protein [Pseudomonas corrugata]MBI6621555.1 Arc family DNA-binding protein [Pseudomonas corrugata]MBI6694210.1 Arc family DNA-binding protein [Pseudomonas corrugata]